jgi:hypothetical protein
MRHRLCSTFVIAALTVLAAGCGASSTSNPKAKLIAQADAICKPLNARRKAANKQVGAVTSAATLPKVAQIAPLLAAFERNAVAELRKLSAPATLAENWRKIVAGLQQLADNTAQLGVYAKASNLKEVEGVIHKSQQKERELITIATTAGFAHCGRNV